MFQDHTPLQAAGQLLLAFAFLATGIRNAGWKFRQHLDRMLAYRVPQARLVLTAGLALQFTGATLLALDLWRPLARRSCSSPSPSPRAPSFTAGG